MSDLMRGIIETTDAIDMPWWAAYPPGEQTKECSSGKLFFLAWHEFFTNMYFYEYKEGLSLARMWLIVLTVSLHVYNHKGGRVPVQWDVARPTIRLSFDFG